MTLRKRLTAALSIAGVLLFALIFTAGALLAQVRSRQSDVVRDYFNVVVQSDDLFTQLIDSETAVRGYALTGQEDFLDPYTQTAERSRQTRGEYNQLRHELGDKPEIAAKLQQTVAAARAWTNDWAEPTIASVRANGASSVSVAEVQRGKELFDRVRERYNDYKATVIAQRSQSLTALRHRTDALIATLVVAGVASALMGAGLWYALRRWITVPIARLAEESRTVAGGNLEHRVTVDGPPEIEELASDVESMRRSLLGQLHRADVALREVQDARAKLEAQAEDLERSNRELEQFAYVASHDLQEPLRKVASFCQMLERRYSGQLDERADQYIAFAVDGAKRMQLLINDLLAFSRVGRITGRRGIVHLEDNVAHAMRNLDVRVEETGATVTWDPMPTVEGESTLLTQVFQNLVGNGIKFHGAEPPRVHIGVSARDDGMWEFCCADNGIGIDAQYAERIFVIFQRLHPKDEYEGTGIGLAMCKKIIEYHGGEIWLDTEVTEGTTFRWTLPALPAEEPDPEVPTDRDAASEPASGAETLLPADEGSAV